MRIFPVLLFGAALFPQTGAPQHVSGIPLTVSVDYITLRANSGPGQCGCFYLNGGSAEVAFPLRHSISLVGEVAGGTSSSVGGNAQGLSLLTYTAGPRIAVSLKRFHPFGEALAGGAYGFNSFFPQTSSQNRASASSVAVLLGGGLDVGISPRVALRLGQVDYLLTRLPNGSSNRQNNLRLEAGIVLRLGRSSSK